jgi:ribose transport system permease protein
MSDRALSAPLSTASALLARVPGVAVMLVLLVVLFAVGARGFASPGNLSNVLLQSAILLILALPMTLIIMTEGLDLSMGAVLTFASVALAAATGEGGSTMAALLVGIAVGTAFGVANGALVALGGIPPFVATLGTLGVAQGLANVVTDGQSITDIPAGLRAVYTTALLGIPAPVWIGVFAYVIFHVLLYRTRFGTAVFALGGNREALRLAGARPERLLIAVYALGGAMAGLAGFLMTARISSAHPTSGIGLEFDAIAAVALGGTSFERGNGWLLGTLLGVVTVGVLRNGLNLMSVPSSAQVVCIGLLVILALFVDGLRRPAR